MCNATNVAERFIALRYTYAVSMADSFDYIAGITIAVFVYFFLLPYRGSLANNNPLNKGISARSIFAISIFSIFVFFQFKYFYNFNFNLTLSTFHFKLFNFMRERYKNFKFQRFRQLKG